MKQKTTYACLLLIYFCFYFSSNAQTTVCENANCNANDYNLNYLYLGDADGNAFGPGYCEPGNPVDATIWTNFTANSAASRYTLYLHFNLYVNGVFLATIDECFYEGTPIPADFTLDIYNFSWECGSEITLENFYLSWQPNPGQPCGCSNSKCFQDPLILVLAPLISNFDYTQTCESEYSLQFNAQGSGGAPPYTYLWDFGDGTTSTDENPTHVFDSSGPYDVTLTVWDTLNSDYFEHEIVQFQPNLPPEVYTPPNSNIEGCSTSDIPDLPLSTSTTTITQQEFENAGGTLTLYNSLVSLTYIDAVSGTCPTTVNRTFTVLDSCNHTTTETQTIVINDTTLPTASNPQPLLLQCNDVIPMANISVVSDAQDNCGNVTVQYISDTSDNLSCPETITRTYRVTDDCGNFIDVSQLIIINDDILPTASNPPTLNVECIEDIPDPDINIITDESDNCDIPIVAFVSEVTDSGTCPLNITRTYSVTDSCNNQILVTHTIILDDTVYPTADELQDLSLQCIEEIPSPDINSLTNVWDNCGNPTINHVGDVSNSASCPEIITRTYSIIDECGNETLKTQEFTILDNQLPTASSLSPINVQCVNDVPAPDTSLINDATDNCGQPVVSFVSDISTGQCPQLITRIYRVEDNCGNYIDIEQDINVSDDIAPTASNPDPMTFNCSSGIPSPDINVVTDAQDNCSVPTVIFVSDTSNQECPEVIERIYSITDDCGNSITVTQQLIFEDTEAPTLDGSINDLTVSCSSIPNTPDLAFIDDCSTNLTVNYSETDTNLNNTVDYEITRVWTVNDSCGNESTFTQTIQVLIADCIVSECNSCGTEDDTIPPTASNPADITVSCTENIPVPDISVVTDAADNCVPPTVAFVSESVSLDCLERVNRVYSVTDECDNTIYVSHNIIVIDDVPPTASNPAPINVTCDNDIPQPDLTVVTDAADNCSSPVVAFVSDVSDNSCNQRIIRTYSVTDGCGNAILVTQEINVIDNIPPTATAPTPTTLECIENVPQPDISVITNVSDNCSSTEIVFLSDISDNNTCPETITRTYRVSDNCGNFIDVDQLFIINDTTLPTATQPNSITVACSADIPVPNINIITDEDDNCATPTVQYIGEVSNNLSCPETITRTYRVTDDCGNFIDVEHIIEINDDILPTASNPSTTLVTSVNNVPIPDTTVVIDEADNCSTPTVAFISESSDDLSCTETLSRVYRVTDACGNFIDVVHQIVINNNQPPTASDPQPLIINCIQELPNPDTSIITDAADNNSTPTVQYISETSNNLGCPETITRTYRVIDDCGNSIDVTHNIIITDDIPPTASNPEDIEVFNANDIPDSNIEIVIDEADNCSIPTVAFVGEISNNDDCTLIITRTYSVTDACGNSINVTHNIVAIDQEAPTASSPQPLTLNCIQELPNPDTNIINDAMDNNSTPTVHYIGDTSNNLSCPETITRTYRVTDTCGNSIDVEHIIEINDDILPTASNPTTTQVNSINEIPETDITVVTDEADNCSTPTVDFISETSDGLSCPETLRRVYRVTDACGNFIDVVHQIVINDNQPPTASNPQSLTLNCVQELPNSDISIVNDATDNNSTTTVTFISDASDGLSCPETITRVYRVTDQCGNSIDVQHIIEINDDIPPTASNPVDIEVFNRDDIPMPNINVVIDEADDCSTPTVAFVEETSNNDNCNEIITRIYSVTDTCGNKIDVSHNIIVIDQEAPTASNPPVIEVSCGNDVPQPDTSVINDAIDNNSTPTVQYIGETSDTFSCPKTITRTYRVSDACGNSIDLEHVIIDYNDLIRPQLLTSFDREMSVSCQEIPDAPVLEFTDDCASQVTVDYSEEMIQIDNENYDIVRIWAASDNCSNIALAEQIIHVNSSPEMVTTPINLCIGDDGLNLNDLLVYDINGTWQSEFTEYFEDGYIDDPSEIPVGNYKVDYSTYEYGCLKMQEFIIEFNDDCIEYPCIRSQKDIKISKIVTPNNDGNNETLNISYTINEQAINRNCNPIVSVKILNRWGTLVYQEENYHNTWKGESPSAAFGSKQYLPTGTYYYIIDIANSGIESIQGYILLGTD